MHTHAKGAVEYSVGWNIFWWGALLFSSLIDEHYRKCLAMIGLVEENWTNMRKRRDRLHIIAEVLVITSNGALKTQVMYKANLSFAQLNEYLSLLLDLGLLKTLKKGEKTVFKTTRKGAKYLKSFSEIRELLASEAQNKNTNPLAYIEKPTW